MDWRLLIIPLVSGFIGWATNALAVAMLFRPRRPVNILGLRIQGLLPKRQMELAAHLGKTVEEHLVSHEDLRAVFAREDVHASVQALLRAKVEFFLENRLTDLNPMIKMFLTGDLKKKLEAKLMAELEPLAPMFAERLLDTLEEEVNFRALVEQKVRDFDLERLELIVKEIASKELRAIEWIGGVLGALIGLIQIAIVKWLE